MDHPNPHLIVPRVPGFAIGRDFDRAPWRRIRAVPLAPSSGEGKASKDSTVRLCWSETHLHAAFDCREAHLRCTYTRRDDPLYNEDVVELFLAPDVGEPCRYFELEFNALGTNFDATVLHPTPDGSARPKVDATWDCDGLEVVARIRERRWQVEAAIPFAGLGVPVPSPGDRWRGNAYRIDYGPPDAYLAWSPTRTPRPNFHVPSRFGTLEFGR